MSDVEQSERDSNQTKSQKWESNLQFKIYAYNCIYTVTGCFRWINLSVIFEGMSDHNGIMNQTPCGGVSNNSRRIRDFCLDHTSGNVLVLLVVHSIHNVHDSLSACGVILFSHRLSLTSFFFFFFSSCDSL